MVITQESCTAYTELLTILSGYLRRMGMHVPHPDYRVLNRHLWVCITISIMYSVMVIKSIYEADNLVETVKGLTTFGAFFQV